MAGKVSEKKCDLWPLTLMGQINQAQNANLKMANLSWDLLWHILYFHCRKSPITWIKVAFFASDCSYAIIYVIFLSFPVCAVGYEGTPGSGSCDACSVGFYRDDLNMTSCVRCPEHKGTNDTGADSLDKCGTFCLRDSSSLTCGLFFLNLLYVWFNRACCGTCKSLHQRSLRSDVY